MQPSILWFILSSKRQCHWSSQVNTILSSLKDTQDNGGLVRQDFLGIFCWVPIKTFLDRKALVPKSSIIDPWTHSVLKIIQKVSLYFVHSERSELFYTYVISILQYKWDIFLVTFKHCAWVLKQSIEGEKLLRKKILNSLPSWPRIIGCYGGIQLINSKLVVR